MIHISITGHYLSEPVIPFPQFNPMNPRPALLAMVLISFSLTAVGKSALPS
jgi:hypothetical protein